MKSIHAIQCLTSELARQWLIQNDQEAKEFWEKENAEELISAVNDNINSFGWDNQIGNIVIIPGYDNNILLSEFVKLRLAAKCKKHTKIYSDLSIFRDNIFFRLQTDDMIETLTLSYFQAELNDLKEKSLSQFNYSLVKETPMKALNISGSEIQDLLLSAGLETETDEFTQKLPGNLSDALKEALEQDKKETNQKLAKRLVSILKHTKKVKEVSIANIRSLRKQERTAVANLAKLQRAEAYATEKGNFIPLLIALGEIDPRTEGGEIPSDWQPAKVEQ